MKDAAEGHWRTPPWQVAGVEAWTTDRAGGVSRGVYASFNLGTHVGDVREAVAANRRALSERSGYQSIQWLEQVHGVRVIRADTASVLSTPEADAAFTTTRGVLLTIMTADCVPVVLAHRHGSVVGAAHCGWRGVANGVLPRLLAQMQVAPNELCAWIAPAISGAVYEVGRDVWEPLQALDNGDSAVRAHADPEKRYVDLPLLVAHQLRSCGVGVVARDGRCTLSDRNLFSYRRDGITGRQVTCIGLTGEGR